MMFTKAYSYHIKKDKEKELLSIHQKSASIYKKYIDGHSLILKSIHDESKWIEFHMYKDEKSYTNAMKLVNNEDELQPLYHAFEDLLSSEITEEDFTLISNYLKLSDL
ncbi:hypothetical protein [Bacillus suaedaesalsae]|uniref:ABM domain-containing protein n=1 Tax=Bacillus suaedaesalsae TaxID=2810349 RepID=A0ABS2DDB4_9BACI|nr:hypothetical protein [Bacillus suaedaesalsae]MBM6616426.1 hypothetical protein [Bacillus suaedaesalsae]